MHSNASISLIIPHVPFPEADAALDRCIESYGDQYDELILVTNEGTGFAAAVNHGLRIATGDYLIVSNNDIELIDGSLRSLAWGKGFCVPSIVPTPRDYKPRAIYSMPRWIYRLVTSCCNFWYDPAFKTGYFEDDDLHRRTANIPLKREESVTVNHLNGGGLTMKTMGEQKWFDINQEVFKKKWS